MEQGTSFGAWLKARRREYGYTQRELAEMVGCSAVTIEKIEAGKNRPSRQIAELIGEALEVPRGEVEEFLRFARGESRAGQETHAHAPSPWLSRRDAGAPAGEEAGPEAEATEGGAALVAEAEERPATAPSAGPATEVRLPAQLTPIVGRDEEEEGVRARLVSEDVRLITLTGPPGIGKTSLALAVAAGLAREFDGGIYFVPLSPVIDPELVPAAIAGALGMQEAGGQAVTESLEKALRDRRVLLVLDNFEQVVSAATSLVGLLAACPGLKALVTSREALHVRGERQYPVPPLALPARLTRTGVEEALLSPAVQLFVERAQAVKPAFEVTEENAEAVTTICARLDGLPLAIELAAARIKLLPPQEILARLDHSLPLLTGGPRDLPERQQTLRGAIGWSFDLLDAAEKTLFVRLGVFVGGMSLSAVEAVCNAYGDLQVDVLDGLASLLDKSLLRKTEGSEEEPRFTILETIRQYALERLEARGEAEELGRLHCEYYLALAELAMPELRGPNQAEWLDRVEREHDNLRAALARALGTGRDEGAKKGEGKDEVDEAHTGVRIVAALWRFWWVRGHLTEWTRWTDLAMKRASDAPAEVQGRLYHGTGILADAHGDYALAAELYRRSLELKRRTGDLNGAAIMLNNLGHLALEQGDMKTAVPILEESLALQREIGDPWGVIFPLHNLATAALEQGDLPRARELYEESLAMRRKSADVWSVAIGVQSMALVETRYGNYDRAEQLYRESLALQAELRSKSGVAGCLVGMAEVAQARGQHERAALLLGVAQGVWDETGSRLSPGEEASLERAMGDLRAAIGPEAVERAWAEGRAMPLERALSEL